MPRCFRYLLILLPLWFGCEDRSSDPVADAALIPLPDRVERLGGKGFELGSNISIQVPGDNPAIQRWGGRMARWIRQQTGFRPPLASEAGPKSIAFREDTALSGPEAYRLEVREERITLSAGGSAGLQYGYQTQERLLGHYHPDPLPAMVVDDAPNFEWRGMHLDVSRHFFPVEDIKTYIDLLARYRFNRFHWHLTDDQGWRIEIKRYPKLQEVAAWREETLVGHNSEEPRTFDGERYGGYYTQDEVREVVRYAARQHITIVPEIEMPGHASAAIAAHPELGCLESPHEVATHWGVFEDVFCPKEETFEFLENVLLEIFELFPSEYIHIGGDECPKTAWENDPYSQQLIRQEGLQDEHELQSYFIQRMEAFINRHGRKIIGWDEILEGGLAPNATVMSWRGEKGGIEAAKMGHDVIMTPTTYCYFDYYQSRDTESEPLAIGGFIPLDSVYYYHPVPEELSPEEAGYVLGAQGNVWTEYMPAFEQVEYMAFPRAIALGEVLWTDPERRDYNDFKKRLKQEMAILDSLGVNARPLDADPRAVN